MKSANNCEPEKRPEAAQTNGRAPWAKRTDHPWPAIFGTRQIPPECLY